MNILKRNVAGMMFLLSLLVLSSGLAAGQEGGDIAAGGASERGGTREFGPGYGHFHIRPHALGDLKHAEASIKTVRGIISSSWKRTKDSFLLEIEIPVNSTAKVSVPTLGLKEFVITEGGKAIWKNDSHIDGVAGIADGRRDAEWVTFDAGSGSYRFELKGKQ